MSSVISHHHARAVSGTLLAFIFCIGCHIVYQNVFDGIGRGVRDVGQSGLRAVRSMVSVVVVGS